MRHVKSVGFAMLVCLLVGCDASVSSSDESAPRVETEMKVSMELSSGGLVRVDTASGKSTSITTVEAPTSYSLNGIYSTSGVGDFTVTPPSTDNPGDLEWNSGTEAPQSVVSPSLYYNSNTVTYQSDGSSKSSDVIDELQSVLADARSDMQDAVAEGNADGLDGPGQIRVQPSSKSGQSAERQAVSRHAPAPGETLKYFKAQGYNVEPLGQGKFELRRSLSSHAIQPVEIIHVYDVSRRQIERTRQVRDGRIVSERILESKENGGAVMRMTHYGIDGKPQSITTNTY